MLNIINVTKKLGNKTVLNEFNLSIQPGEAVGIIGPNGSGKTTLLNILMGTIKPSSGGFTIQNEVKMGMSVSRKGFFNDMSALNNILLYARLNGVTLQTVEELLQEFNIDFGKTTYGSLSAGMKQRVSLVTGLVVDANIVLLDEPFSHLDIDSIFVLRDLICKRKKQGVSFLLTSHIFSDIEKICDRIIFLKQGEIIQTSLTAELLETHGTLEQAYLNIFS
jgi:ABC-2 type transport system ATP-binding protein